MSDAWEEFDCELARWREIGRPVEFWWRDDDASRPDPALDQLLQLASESGIPLALAVIPDSAQPAAFKNLRAGIAVLQHGVDHSNRAEAGEKKTEFPSSQPVEDALTKLAGGRAKLEALFGANRVLPVLVPPWNRIAPALVSHLAGAGYRGLSTFGRKKVTNFPAGVTLVNTHVDIIDWKGGRKFWGSERVLNDVARLLAERRTGASSASEPVGWLTHHAVHDAQAWQFLDRLFRTSREAQGVVWRSAESLFEAEPLHRARLPGQ